MVRTFVAVYIPDRLVREAANYQEYLKKLDTGVRWVRQENLHITLKFLGDVDASRISELNYALKAALSSETSFSASLEGCGTFPQTRSPRTVWLGLAQGASRLIRLASRVDTAISGLGFQRELRSFKPHVTIGRVKSTRGISALLDTMHMHPFDGGKFSVDTVYLMKSQLTEAGAEYSILETFNLRG
ncbi:RNA 2',3'-cyclic phosphodiesterase [bacterium]|nr:RNA 2',3'-cyclic phosphodiesterase [bacterium]